MIPVIFFFLPLFAILKLWLLACCWEMHTCVLLMPIVGD